MVGTNLSGTAHYEIAKDLSKEYGFEMRENITGLGQHSLVFASEYFEHITNPIEHLNEVVEEISPNQMLIANGFATRAPGHFLKYEHGQHCSIPAKEMKVMFARALRSHGYQKIKTKVWNQRPALWAR